jgi:hypothetical protein
MIVLRLFAKTASDPLCRNPARPSGPPEVQEEQKLFSLKATVIDEPLPNSTALV